MSQQSYVLWSIFELNRFFFYKKKMEITSEFLFSNKYDNLFNKFL